MESREIIDNIQNIYSKYNIPPWLQEHMRRAAAVGWLICEHWQGPPVVKEDVIARNLLHDMGNIIKFNLDSGLTKKQCPSEDIDFYKKVQQEFIEKYGKNELRATEKIVKEIGGNGRVLGLIEGSEFLKNTETLKTEDWERKICTYSDQRVAPFGVMSLQERYKEHRARNMDDPNYFSPHRTACFDAGKKIEKQVLAQIDIAEAEINDETIAPLYNRL